MKSLAESDLLQTCVQRMQTQLNDQAEDDLRFWWNQERESAAPLSAIFLSKAVDEWEQTVSEHPAHRHVWYDQLAHDVTVQEFATFFLENWPLPAFLSLVERTLQSQICEEGRAAVLRNIEDEQKPTPHVELMRRLIVALKAKAGDGLPLELYPSLIDRILVFYYGYYCDPWHLVGSLYATEVMAHHRMEKMNTGLKRLGFEGTDLEFIELHMVCDEDHARDWSEGVIASSLRLNPTLRAPIVEGIASCLDTSVHYLDDLSRRATDPHSDNGVKLPEPT